MATYYVATTGNDSNLGTIGSPFLTIPKGLSVMVAGDTLLIRAGSYGAISSNTQTIPSGTSFTNAITVAAYPSEAVTLRAIGLSGAPYKYIIFDRLKIDGQYDGNNNIVYLNGTNHIRFTTCEITRSSGQGALVTTGSANNPTSHTEFINCSAHHNGPLVPSASPQNHGMYIAAPYTTVSGGSFYNNEGYGVQCNNSYGFRMSGIVFKNFTSRNNGSGGISINGADGALVFNNIVYGHTTRAGISVSWWNPTGVKVYNNTVYNNTVAGIEVTTSGATGTIIKNNIIFQCGGGSTGISDAGSGTVRANNLPNTTNPLFVNAGSANFALQAGSQAIDFGTTLPEVTTDIIGTSRPQGTAYDIGAYEFVGGGTPDTTPPTGAVVSPTSGGTVSGTVNVICTATDNVGVANVQFYLDGSPLGGPVT